MDNPRQPALWDNLPGAMYPFISRFTEGNTALRGFALVCKTWAAAVRFTAQRFSVTLDTQASAESAAAELNRAYAAHPDGEGRTAPITLEVTGSGDMSSALAAHFFQALSDGARAEVVGLECSHLTGVYPAGHPPPHQVLPKLQSLKYFECECWSSLHIADLPHLDHLTAFSCGLETLTLGANLTRFKKLEVNSNRLTHLDLSSVRKLSYLDLSWNQLTALDLSCVLKLSHLNVARNGLTALDLSCVRLLSHLNVSGNRLVHLGLSRVPRLTHLCVATNLLTALDLSSVPQLSYLDANCNQLTALDLSRVTQLSHLEAFDNQLTSLDLSSVPQLSHLVVFSNKLPRLDLGPVPRLTTLSCSWNKLSELDVEGLQDLEYINCSHNRRLTSLTLASPRLHNVECWGCPLTQLTIQGAAQLAYVRYSCQGEFRLTLPTPVPEGLELVQVPPRG